MNVGIRSMIGDTTRRIASRPRTVRRVEGMVPDDATVAYISTLDGSREERAFNLAKHDYYGFLDYKEDRYTTVYGYMD